MSLLINDILHSVSALSHPNPYASCCFLQVWNQTDLSAFSHSVSRVGEGSEHHLTHISSILADGIGELAAKIPILFISCGHKAQTVRPDFASLVSMPMAKVLY